MMRHCSIQPSCGLGRAREGATAVEFALVSPALFLLVFGTLEFGRLMWTQSALHFAVEEAARCASVNSSVCGTASQIASYAAGTVTALNITSASFTATSPACGHQIKASYSYQFMATGLFPFTPTLTAQACFP
jgi:Flp pilus assembly protein TadG